MQKIPLNLADPGMVLAKPIITDKGLELCAEGTVLTAPIIARLVKMQIAFVTLKGNPVEPVAAAPTDAAFEQELNARFSKVQGDPAMNKIKAAVGSTLRARNLENADPASRESPA